ncbi:MAG: hypothetical protein QW275_02030, partial [Candidatus Anstonellaceae archaeon]
MDKASRVSAGFTFTISALVISLTLISMAQFSSDWRRSQQASSEMTPSKLPFGIQNSLASDFSSILGVKANADRTGTYSARSKVEINFPFEQEGMNRKRVEKYPFLLGGAVSQSGLEVSLYLQPIIENKSVMLFPKNGSLDIGEDGQFEYAIYNHPEGWSLHE